MRAELLNAAEKILAERERLIASSLEHHKRGEFIQADRDGDAASRLGLVLRHLHKAIDAFN